MSDCRLLVRPRLLELAGERWTRRVVTLVAGPGFGKSVLLAQLSAENRLAPRGAELVVACRGATVRRRRSSAVSPTPWTRPEHVAATCPAPIGPARSLCRARPALATRRLRGARRCPPRHGHRGGRPGCSASSSPKPLRPCTSCWPSAVRWSKASPRCAPAGRSSTSASGSSPCRRPSCGSWPTIHGTDLDVIARSGGWPAVACVSAAYGIDSAGDYVWETVLEHLDERHRRVLAVATAVGPCDRELLRAAVDAGDEATISTCSPSCRSSRRRDGELVVHDLWRRTVQDALTDDDRRDAVARAAAALVRRGDYDRARRLCASHELWLEAIHVLRACCRHGYPEVRPHVLTAWLDALPPERR